MGPPLVSVLIASDRVEGSLPETLASLEGQAPPDFEVLVASAREPPPRERSFPVRWIEVADRNPAVRRNRAAAASNGSVLAFLDDDAVAERGWLAAGARAMEASDAAGGPDPGPDGAPFGERLANLLLATPVIGSGVPAHERSPRPGPVRSPHDVALCNLFLRRELFERLGGFDERLGYVGEDTDLLRRAMDSGARVVLDPAFPVRHRRRAFPAAFLAQRWRYRIKTGRLLVERPGLHDRGKIAAFLAAGFLATAASAIWGPAFLLPALAGYAALTWALSFPIWRRDPALFPAVPFAFALHHATYFAGLIFGIARGALSGAAR
ncbi:MAG TPA: glycosyltransferase [Thermoanaerobaculia bacterium]